LRRGFILWKTETRFVKFLTNGFVSVISIALLGVAFGLWTRQTPPSHQELALTPATDLNVANQVTSTRPTLSLQKSSPENSSAEQSSALEVVHLIKTDSEATNSTLNAAQTQLIEMLPGIAHPLHVAEIAAAADGPLWKLYVAEGDIIHVNKVLALIDNRVAVASVQAAQSAADRQAMLSAANAKVSLAEQYLKRINQAATKNAASGLEIDEATSRLQEAKAALQEGLETQREAAARLQIEQARLETHEVRAPFDGTVIKIYPHLGETVSRSAPIIKIADISRLRADLYIPLSLISSQRVGETIELRADLPGRPLLNAKIVFVAPLIDAATQTIRIVVEIENNDKHLPAGFAVRLSNTGTGSDMH
jgi:RND family efflux transporter MFP subunit